MATLIELGRRARSPRWLGVIRAAAAALALSATPAAAASDNVIVQISSDPFTNATSQHQTEVEPDTFAFGGTWVSAFQVGRFFDGGASDIGFASNSNESNHFQSGFLPGVTTFSQPAGPYDRASDASVAFDLRDHVWQDCRFEAGCGYNDMVLSTSSDGTTWSAVRRIPADPVGSNVDHFIPGLGVDRRTLGDDAHLALTYYMFPNASCTVATCQLEVAFVTSRDAGASWSQPQVLTGPMNLGWVAETNQGFMVADYISTSFVVGQQARTAFAVASAPAAPGAFQQAMFTDREDVKGGDVQTADDAVQFVPGTPAPGVDDGSDDSANGL